MKSWRNVLLHVVIIRSLLCLPGDFAVLLKAGMTVRQAILYNVLSAMMAYLGMVTGILIGHYADNICMWIFALTAGLFLYVALVDMVSQPQTQTCTSGRSFPRAKFSFCSYLGKRVVAAGFLSPEQQFENTFLLRGSFKTTQLLFCFSIDRNVATDFHKLIRFS